MSQDDIRILFEQPDARVQVGLMVEVVVGGPFEQGRRRELEHPIEICDSPEVPPIANIMNASIARTYSLQICGVRSLEALSQIRISKSVKVWTNKLSSSSGNNSCPLNTGIPIESLGIELEHPALIRTDYVGHNGLINERLRGTTFWQADAATRAELRLHLAASAADERASGHPHPSAAADHEPSSGVNHRDSS